MIRAIRCDQPSFREVVFTAGMNVVLAERADTSSEKDSRNGLGKSTLIEIIHFCLGATAHRDGGIFSVKVRGWTYFLEMTIMGQPLIVSRNTSTAEANRVTVTSRFDYTTAETLDKEANETVMSVESWRDFLGLTLFSFPPDSSRHYTPSFRSLISYMVRTGKDSYTTPFEHHRKQLEWDKQVNNAFLLGLAWEDASDLQEKKEEKQDLDARTRFLAQQVQGNPRRLLGALEASRIQIRQKLSQEEKELSNFQVHPQYQDINVSVDRLTAEIHALVNANVADNQVVELYRSDNEDDGLESAQVERLYAEVGVTFPDKVQRRLVDVQEFHHQVVINRRNFLASEITRLERLIVARKAEIETKSVARATRMEILQTHGALSEYHKLQSLFFETQGNLNILETRIGEIRGLEQRKSQYRIELEQLQQRMRDDYDARAPQRQRAVELFNSNSEIIYDVQGTLIINVTATGFKYDVEIKRDGSDGIGNMKVFCYDLMLAELWANAPASPRFLVHDSIIFDGVDERQVKNAIELAAHTSVDQGFQYIFTLNSDNIPWNEFSEGFNFQDYIRLILKDDTEEGGLLGVRF
jgi:uncharacterized protein YydD (DUF2326 family)